MNKDFYLRCIAQHYMCDIELASKIIKSAELNGSKQELDKIVEEKEGADIKNDFFDQKINW